MKSRNPKLELIVDIGEPRTHPARDRKRGTPDGCAHCGERHWNCSGHSQRTGRPCNHNPMRGQTKCFLHGGRSPQAMTTARKRVAKKEAIEILGTLQFVVRKGTSVAQLQTAIDMAAKQVDDRWRDVESLNGDLVVEENDWRGAKRLVVHPYLILYNEALDRFTKFLVSAMKLGLEDRRLELAREQGDFIFGAFTRAVEACALEPAQAERLRLSFAAELRPPGELAA